jgi:endonuclease/exonuclease/phosphatase family metal-dependent hydrolase
MRSLRVATLNIWHDAGPWPQRLPLIRQEIDRLQPEVLGLQEVLRHGVDTGGVDTATATADTCQAMAIADGTGYHVAYAPAAPRGGEDSRWQGNAVLSRWPIRDQRVFALPCADVAEPRSLLYALLQTPLGDLPVFVTHLAWEPEHGPLRLRQVRYIATQISALVPPDGPALPALLMGDLNAEPDSAEVRHLLDNGFADAWVGGPAGYTFDRVNDYAREADEPSCRIDYILIRAGNAATLHTRLAFIEPDRSDAATVWPSDHFGVVSDVIVDGRLPQELDMVVTNAPVEERTCMALSEAGVEVVEV